MSKEFLDSLDAEKKSPIFLIEYFRGNSKDELSGIIKMNKDGKLTEDFILFCVLQTLKELLEYYSEDETLMDLLFEIEERLGYEDF